MTVLAFPAARVVRTIVHAQVSPLVIICEDASEPDRELAEARRQWIKRRALRTTTGHVGHVARIERASSGSLVARFFWRAVEAETPGVYGMCSDNVALGELTQFLGPHRGGAA